ncbi:MAG: glycolate oxidase subunit GlcF [Rhodospirillaceae bacterium]
MTPAPNQAFDQHHPPPPELINQCVHCGFCLPACPTYVLWGNEMDSPRGRIYLMKMASEGATAMTDPWVHHIDTCLGCMSCMTACPSGVDYAKLIEATRAQIERRHPRSAFEKLQRWMIFSTFPRIDRLRMLRPFLRAYQQSGLQSLVRGLGILKLLPKHLRAMEALMPALGESQAIAGATAAQGQQRKRVGLLLGCVQREFLPEINAATIRVLAAEGCEVIAPADQPCCGALMVHAGEETPALELARRVIDVFERELVDLIITNAGGCGSNVREYGYQLRDDPQYAERAARFSAKCKDVCEFLEEIGSRAARNPLNMRVAYHDSCHLQHAQRVRTQPRALLSAIPGVEMLDLPESTLCCGSAGIYNLVQPDTADALADRKAQHITTARPDVVATGNIGCMLQIAAALERQGQKTPVLHTIQIMDASINGRRIPER